ncbi:MAG TPA: Uma2 family endonuclease [Tepidisphaeraceae bacterium]|nr:Uma2 family endonuclease [Tepidisphaeraceae bacterium]
MSTLAGPVRTTPLDVERASKAEGKRFELVRGELKEKAVGFWALFIAVRIAERLNAHFYPNVGAAAVEVMIYCFARADHGRRPDVVFVRNDRFPDRRIPDGDIRIVPDLVVEVLSPANSGIDVEDKLDEYLGAGISMVWIVNPDRRTIRIYRGDGTTRLFRAGETMENEPALPGFRLPVADVFPEPVST